MLNITWDYHGDFSTISLFLNKLVYIDRGAGGREGGGGGRHRALGAGLGDGFGDGRLLRSRALIEDDHEEPDAQGTWTRRVGLITWMADVTKGYASWQAFGDNRDPRDHDDNTGYFFLEGFVDNRYRVFSSLFYVYAEEGDDDGDVAPSTPTAAPSTAGNDGTDDDGSVASVSPASSAATSTLAAMGATFGLLCMCCCAVGGRKAGLWGDRHGHGQAEPASWMDGWAEAIGITPVVAQRAPEGPAGARVVEAVAIEMSKPRGTLAVAEVIEDDMILGRRPDSAMRKIARDSREKRRGSSLGATQSRGRTGKSAFQQLVRRYSGSGEHEYTTADLDADEEETATLRRPSMASPPQQLRRPSIAAAVELRRPSIADPRAAEEVAAEIVAPDQIQIVDANRQGIFL